MRRVSDSPIMSASTPVPKGSHQESINSSETADAYDVSQEEFSGSSANPNGSSVEPVPVPASEGRVNIVEAEDAAASKTQKRKRQVLKLVSDREMVKK